MPLEQEPLLQRGAVLRGAAPQRLALEPGKRPDHVIAARRSASHLLSRVELLPEPRALARRLVPLPRSLARRLLPLPRACLALALQLLAQSGRGRLSLLPALPLGSELSGTFAGVDELSHEAPALVLVLADVPTVGRLHGFKRLFQQPHKSTWARQRLQAGSRRRRKSLLAYVSSRLCQDLRKSLCWNHLLWASHCCRGFMHLRWCCRHSCADGIGWSGRAGAAHGGLKHRRAPVVLLVFTGRRLQVRGWSWHPPLHSTPVFPSTGRECKWAGTLMHGRRAWSLRPASEPRGLLR
mmetsp:Transcript_12295/g.18541  ORF Transcript_12295/g.18541 Transcript_12295/m.18541 type:complete len:295 (-) Transcript_12295:6-890(-)